MAIRPLSALLVAVLLSAAVVAGQASLQFEALQKELQVPAAVMFRVAGASAPGDLDGDGDTDLVISIRLGQNLLYLNDGTGKFADVTTQGMPRVRDASNAISVGDVDKDGDLDMVIGVDSQNRLLLNDGKAKFSEATSGRLPSDKDKTKDVVMGDVDRDGDLDLILANAGSRNRLYLNDGKGKFVDATAARLPAAKEPAAAVALGDVDGDGDLDLLFGNSGQSRLYLNDGKGKFTDVTSTHMPSVRMPTSDVAFVDVNGDGRPDIVTANDYRASNTLFLNDGKGRFKVAAVGAFPADKDYTNSVSTGDVDGDGDQDVVFGRPANSKPQARLLRLYLNDGSGRFSEATTSHLPPTPRGATMVLLVDVDGDRDPDLFTGDKLFLNSRRGHFEDVRPSATTPGLQYGPLQNAAVGDLDGDGHLDFVGVFSVFLSSLVLVEFGDGKGGFERGRFLQAGYSGRATSVALGDVDGDGDLDLAVGSARACHGSNCWGGQSGLLLNDGRGKFASVTATHLPRAIHNASQVSFADVDRDGDLDLLLRSGGRMNLYSNGGKGKFSDVSATHMPTGTLLDGRFALGDVDGDGDMDIVLGDTRWRTKGGQTQLYVNDGKGKFKTAATGAMPSDYDSTEDVRLGDVDGDGDLDVYLVNAGTLGQPNKLYLNNGKGKFTDGSAGRLPRVAGKSSRASLRDFDLDGDLDILVRNGIRGTTRYYENDGKGFFTDGTGRRIPLGISSTSIIDGDFDGDGDVDFLLADSQNAVLYRNLHRQIDSAPLARVGRPYVLDLYAKPGYATSTQWALAMLSPTEQDPGPVVPPFGRLRLGVRGLVRLAPIAIFKPGGKVTIRLPVPNVTGLKDVMIYAQALIVHSSAATQWKLTNVIADRIY
jgi:large repetitive protein